MLQIFLFWDCPERFWFRFVWRLKKTGIENLLRYFSDQRYHRIRLPPQAYKEGGYEPGRGTNLVEGAGKIYYKTGTEHH